jgi:bacterioferritin-associated ferredoxin
MIVCICHRVSDRDIARELRAGCPDFDTLQQRLGFGRSCGSCLPCARDLFDGTQAPATAAGVVASAVSLPAAPGAA